MVFSERPLEDRRIGVLQSFFCQKKKLFTWFESCRTWKESLVPTLFAFINCHGQHFSAAISGCFNEVCQLPRALCLRTATGAAGEGSYYGGAGVLAVRLLGASACRSSGVTGAVCPSAHGLRLWLPDFFDRASSIRGLVVCCWGGFGFSNQLDILGGWWANIGRAWPQLFFWAKLRWAIRIRKPSTNAWAPFDDFPYFWWFFVSENFWGTRILYITPAKFNIALKINLPKRKVVFQPSFFRGYVKLWVLLLVLGNLLTVRGGKTHNIQEIPCCRPRLRPALLATFLWSSRNSRSTRHFWPEVWKTAPAPEKSPGKKRISFQPIIFQGLGELLNFRGWFSITCFVIGM